MAGFNFLDMAKLLSGEPLQPDWLVPDLLHKSTSVILMSKAGMGKSFISYSLGIALATGSHFFGSKLDPSRVLYIEHENSPSVVQKYAEWAWQGMYSPDLDLVKRNFFLAHYPFDAYRDSENSMWGPARAAVSQVKPHLIVIDTANSVCDLPEENDNASASRAMNELKRLLPYAAPGCVLLVLKHALDNHKDRSVKTVRGAKAWEGIADAVLHLGTMKGGKPDKEGWRRTILTPVKTRAFGLRHPLLITPVHTSAGGVQLHTSPLIDRGNDE